MSKQTLFLTLASIAALALLFFVFFDREEFSLPEGEAVPFEMDKESMSQHEETNIASEENGARGAPQRIVRKSTRQVFVTDRTKHSIPLSEILSGGPGKDGIPSIDNPVFLSANEAEYLEDENPGIGLTVHGESRFYPYRILVWHEIVNDTVGGVPVLVTYCPLCATGIVFERRVDGEVQEFGVSGMLWQSNLLMYNRARNEEAESLWSQVLGEAVVGQNTGEKLAIIPSDIVRWGEWREIHPDTKVLSRSTGAVRNYSADPYGDYYTNESVSFGATFSDTRLHPKALVHGIEIDGNFKAYEDQAVQRAGTFTDSFAGRGVVVSATASGGVRFTVDGEALPSIPGFWFSWIAVHPTTELYQ